MTNRTPDWIQKFPLVDGVDYFWADIFWDGSLVDRHGLVAADGGRIYLPLPLRVFRHDGDAATLERYEVTQWHVAFARLLHYVEHQDDFDAALKRADFRVVSHLSD